MRRFLTLLVLLPLALPALSIADEPARPPNLVILFSDELTKELVEVMHADPAPIECAVALISAARDLERIADMATNIAEDIVFLFEGELIRHAYRQQESSS